MNVVFLLADQLRAASLPAYGERQIETPNIDRLAAEGVTFDNAVSTCPICSPYRSMLVTGRHPQTTGHVINFVDARCDEISVGDAFRHAGYRTAWVGKWHLNVGGWPGGAMDEGGEGPSYIPEGRPRMGFDHWRTYNFHEEYFNGWVNKDNWFNERWDGYETEALNRYAFEFMDSVGDEPFCLFISPHQPHKTCCGPSAPDDCYARLPAELTLPENVPEAEREKAIAEYRDYLAMTLAIDDMVGELLDYLDRTGRAQDTLLVFTSDHGSQFGAHGLGAWEKGYIYEESLHVPLIVRGPEAALQGGLRRDTLIAPPDFFPTLCGLCGVPVPRTVEGRDLSAAMRGEDGAPEQDAVLAMGFIRNLCFLDPPSRMTGGRQPWRGVRTKTHTYVRYLDGRAELYDLTHDPLQMRNLAGQADVKDLEQRMEATLKALLRERHDDLVSPGAFADWIDSRRRIVRNAHGELPHPESPPDWSLLT